MEKILAVLNDKFVCDPRSIALYANTVRVRYDGATDALDNVTSVLTNTSVLRMLFVTNDYKPVAKAQFPLTLDQNSLLTELKYLNVKNIDTFLEWDGINPHMRKYIEALLQEIKAPSLMSPSSSLQQIEAEMLAYLLNQPFDEGHENIQSIANKTLRVILQTWMLHPNLICNKTDTQVLIDSLYISNCEL